MELLISKVMYEIPIPLLIRNDSLSFNKENLIRGYHVYMAVWNPLLGKRLFGKKEPSKEVDKNAVAVICLNSCVREEVVGHVPRNISKVVLLSVSLCLYVSLFVPHCYLEHEVTGKHVNRGYGLEIPPRFRFLWA